MRDDVDRREEATLTRRAHVGRIAMGVSRS